MPSLATVSALKPLLSPSVHQTKTIDFGASGRSASLSTSGRLVALFAPHPTHGQILVAPWAQFPEDRYHDIPFVREYRALPFIAHDDPEAGFGMSLRPTESFSEQPSWSYASGSWPHSTQSNTEITLTSDYVVSGDRIVHHITCTNNSSLPQRVDLVLDGSFSVHRASYSQLTPQGDLSIPPVDNVLSVDKEGSLSVHNPHLPASFTCSIYVDGRRQMLGHMEAVCKGPVHYSSSLKQTLGPAEARQFSAVYTLCPGKLPPPTLAQLDVNALTRQAQPSTQGLDPVRLAKFLGGGERGESLAFIVLRNVDYLLGCCTVPITDERGGDKGSCIITDHQCLPLGWNRDNYWQLDLLSSLIDNLPAVASLQTIPSLRKRLQYCIRSHLLWVFNTAQRPQGHWARCFYLGGQPKDTVFQLDQQCYPLLELAEYAERFATELSGGEGWQKELEYVRSLARGNVDQVLRCLQEHRWLPCQAAHPEARLWLFKTDETPADDAVEYPYHFSSHVLLWRTLDRLAALQILLGDDTIVTPVRSWADRVKEDTLQQFTTVNPSTGKEMFSYLASTTGQYQFYHDANDLPTALAPAWGFCQADSDPWINTVSFAFSSCNVDGFYPGGPFGGLGSVHTRDPWPLADGQQLAILATQSDRGLKNNLIRQATLDKIVREAQWDGLFSEAVDRHSGVVTSKHYFSWPGAFISSILLSRQAALFDSEVSTADVSFSQHILRHLGQHRRSFQGAGSCTPPLFVGMQGPQGSGKTYITSMLSELLQSSGVRAVIISSDDLYLPATDLKGLSKSSGNSMLSGRGPPGTHDLALGLQVLTDLRDRREGRIAIPSFDKYANSGYGDRAPKEDWREVPCRPDVVILEGWSHGFRALPEGNLEQLYCGTSTTRGGRFRSRTKDEIMQLNVLLRDYESLWYPFFTVFCQIEPLSLDSVQAWRLDAEHAARSQGKTTMTDGEVVSFVDRYMPCYELFGGGVRALSQPWSGAGIAVKIDQSRRPIGIKWF